MTSFITKVKRKLGAIYVLNKFTLVCLVLNAVCLWPGCDGDACCVHRCMYSCFSWDTNVVGSFFWVSQLSE